MAFEDIAKAIVALHCFDNLVGVTNAMRDLCTNMRMRGFDGNARIEFCPKPRARDLTIALPTSANLRIVFRA